MCEGFKVRNRPHESSDAWPHNIAGRRHHASETYLGYGIQGNDGKYEEK